MSGVRPRAAAITLPERLVREQLAAILSSDASSRSERLSAFLRFVVEETLAARGDTLKEQVIAVELYKKGPDFSTAADPIVRVDARRLRDKLREYYAAAPNAPIIISIPKGVYTPTFEVNSPGNGDDVRLRRAVRVQASRPLLAIAGIVAIGAAVLLATRSTRRADSLPFRLLTVTALPGSEEDPALSPDGNFVAFSWKGDPQGGFADIWIKAVDGDATRRLTHTPDAHDKWPQWSPNGQHITFTRIGGGPPSVLIASVLEGHERIVSDDANQPFWLPDSRSLVMVARGTDGRPGLVRHLVETGERRQLTATPEGFTDLHPRVSPDGTTVAFMRAGVGRVALFLVPITGGEAKQLTDWVGGIGGGHAWTTDGTEIVFAEPRGGNRILVRVPLGGGVATPVNGIPYQAVSPSVSAATLGLRHRLALAYGEPDLGLRMIDLRAARGDTAISAVSPFCDATRMDIPGRFSRDGTQVAFVSSRSGNHQLWVAQRDGSGLSRVTALQDATVNVGSWSPDGRWVAFDATIGDNTDIYIARATGGSIKRLTSGKAAEMDPEWSRDGRWIYYASNQSGRSEIWRMTIAGEERVRLTAHGAFEPRESSDGQSVYFVDAPRSFALAGLANLKRVAGVGGAEHLVYSGIHPGAWDITDAGIVFVTAREGEFLDVSREPDSLSLFDFAEGRVRKLGELGFRIGPFGTSRFLIVSRDGGSAVASHIDRWDRDILVVDNFR
jgi:Tol biopolymer transport system component